MGGGFGKIGSVLSSVGSKIGNGVRDVFDNPDKTPDGQTPPLVPQTSPTTKIPWYNRPVSPLQKRIAGGISGGAQAYQQQQMSPRGGQPVQFQVPDASLPPEFYETRPINPNLFYGG